MNSETIQTTKPRQSLLGLVILIYIAFIALGMPDGLLGVAWPSIRAGFGIPLDALGAFLFTGMIGYMLSSTFSGPMTNRWGVGRVLIASCLATGAALIGYTLMPAWWMMVALGFLSGLGAGGIDSSLNGFVARHYDSGLMQWLHASYGIGVTSGPLIMTYFLSGGSSWRNGYLVVGGFQLVLAAIFVFTLPLWQRQPEREHLDENGEAMAKPGLAQSLRHGKVWLGLVMFLFYTGAEVTLGTWTYSLLTESRGFDPKTAGLFAGSYWASFTIGRILAGVIAKRVSMKRLVRACILLALAGASLLIWNPTPWSSLVAVVLLGLAYAPIYPGLVTLTAERTGHADAANAIGLQQATGSLGASGLTALVGVLARRISLEAVPWALAFFLLALLGLFLLGHGAGSGNNSPLMPEPARPDQD